MFSYQFHIRDYLTKTRHLSQTEDLAYRRLMDVYYTEEKPLPLESEDCARLIAMRDHAKDVDRVLHEFFTKADDGWRNDRCDFEIEKYHGKAESARRANKAKISKKESLKSELKSEQIPEPIQDATHKPKNPRTLKPTLPTEWFDSFWSAYPRKVAKAEALKAFTKINPDETVLAKMLASVNTSKQSTDWLKDGGQFVPFPSTWLNQRRWEDESSEQTNVHFEGML
jgi:uncharacterized protein YdaU (DUF1376 family)